MHIRGLLFVWFNPSNEVENIYFIGNSIEQFVSWIVVILCCLNIPDWKIGHIIDATRQFWIVISESL